MRIFYSAPTDNGSNLSITDSVKAAEQIKQQAEQSLVNIVDKAFTPDILPPGNTEIPLGDGTATSQNFSPIKPPTTPMVSQGEIFKSIDDLNQDIDTAQLEGAKSPESIRSFDGLKARYKNKTKAIRDQVQSLHTQVTALTTQLEGLDTLKEKSKKYEEVAPTVFQLEEQVKNLGKENETLNYYRRKYDLENDPTVKEEFIEPMKELRAKSMDILEHSNLDEDFWKQLIDCDSEFKINSAIDNARISGMNAQSLKRNVGIYQQLKNGYTQISTPENIDAAIDTAKGRRLQNAKEMSEKVFTTTQTAFSDWIDELKSSDFNKEHNHFVFDKVVEQAKTNYENLKKVLPPDQINAVAMHSMAKASLMAAAYPAQKVMLEHALKIIADLTKEIKESGTHKMKQTKESQMPLSSNGVEELKKEATKTIEQIAAESFNNRLI